jgi:hypothetical protein
MERILDTSPREWPSLRRYLILDAVEVRVPRWSFWTFERTGAAFLAGVEVFII